MSIKFFLDQHGCSKNQVDGEIIISILTQNGFEQTFDVGKAKLIIINSCGFIESAKKECLEAVYSARSNYPKAKILLAGCLAERYAQELSESLLEADAIFGNGDLSKIVDAAKAALKSKHSFIQEKQEGISCAERQMFLSFPASTYIKITEGCNNRCAFCAIPLIRGNLRSRKASEIVKEIKKLLSQGIFEFNLIGQDLAAYGAGQKDSVFGKGRTELPHYDADKNQIQAKTKSALCELLEEITKIKGNFWIRLLYIDPDNFNKDILKIIKSDKRILPYFDMPFQSGSSDVIKKMYRRGSRVSYEKVITDVRKVLPDAAIRTTLLSGFPGETDEDALETQDFLKTIEPDWAGTFAYSKEDGTAAAKFKGVVPKKTAEKRAADLVAIQSEITKKRIALRVGKDYDVLIEEVVEGEDEGLAIGRAWFQAPDVDGSVVVRYEKEEAKAIFPGALVRVHADRASDIDLDSVYIGEPSLKKATHRKSSLQFAPEIENKK